MRPLPRAAAHSACYPNAPIHAVQPVLATASVVRRSSSGLPHSLAPFRAPRLFVPLTALAILASETRSQGRADLWRRMEILGYRHVAGYHELLNRHASSLAVDYIRKTKYEM